MLILCFLAVSLPVPEFTNNIGYYKEVSNLLGRLGIYRSTKFYINLHTTFPIHKKWKLQWYGQFLADLLTA